VVAAQFLEFGMAPAVRGGLPGDEIAGQAAAGQGPDSGADGVFGGEGQAEFRTDRRAPEHLLEHLHLAALAGGRIGDGEPGGERICPYYPDGPPAFRQPGLGHCGDARHVRRFSVTTSMFRPAWSPSGTS
jgi:hypothetical protein